MALIKLNSRAIPDSTVVNTDIADGSVTQAKVADGSISSAKLAAGSVTADKTTGVINKGKNLLINGNFDVWQRATSFTDVAGIWKYGHADRWNGHNDGADAGTYSQSTVVPNSGSLYSMLLTGASGVTNTNFSQRIESDNLKGIRKVDSFTISGYVRSATAGKVINIHALCPTAKDDYAGYTQHNSVMSSVTISGDGTTGTSQITLTSADTWYYFTATKTSATSLTNFNNGYAVFFSIIGQTSSSHQVYMTQLQIEAGTTATDFEHRSYGEQLALCERYFETSYVTGITPGSAPQGSGAVYANTHTTSAYPSAGEVRWRTKKRATPAVAIYNSQTGTTNSVYGHDNGVNTAITAVNSISENGFGVFYASGGGFTAGYRFTYHYTADSEL